MKTWKIDPIHSEIKFKVKHLVVSTVTGQFNSFEGTVKSANDDFSDSKITFEADMNSISTNNEMRDNHLKSADFFDTENHPKLTFISNSFTKKSENEYEVVGDITIRGITKEIKLNAELTGTGKGFGDTDVAGFEITGKLNRFDFGLHWNGLTEAGGIAVSSDVKLEINVELHNVIEANQAA